VANSWRYVEGFFGVEALSSRFPLLGFVLLRLGISDTGERKDFEVYSCDVSLDGSRLVSAAGGEWILLIAGSS
jgi:hypothetical protein